MAGSKLVVARLALEQPDEPEGSAMSQIHFITDVDGGALLEAVRPAVTALARRFYYRVSFLGIELDDLEQEGMIAAWQATLRVDPGYTHEQACSFCLCAARGAIVTTIQREDRLKVRSLEAYLVPRAGGPVRELADCPGERAGASLALRRSVLGMLRGCLSEKQILAVMAGWSIDRPETGKAPTREQVTARLGISTNGYYTLRSRALRKLRARARAGSLLISQSGVRLSGERGRI